MMKKLMAAATAVALLAGCHGMAREQAATAEPLQATAALQPTQGSKAFGEATFEQMGDHVHVIVNAQGLKPNQEHGFHIHEAGDCSSGDGMSAKGHFNTAGKPHGNPTASEHHAGDLPALKADKDGRAKLDAMVEGITLAPGPTSIVGRGLIIHADPDDYQTQPTGNSGARIACGVIKAG
jgi:superoxide dismutase, Cu-Zn family